MSESKQWPPELSEFPADISDIAVDVVDRITWAMPNIEEMRFRVAEAILAERDRCARIATEACLVPPDGGSPTEAERLVCEEAARRIRGEFSISKASPTQTEEG